MERISKFQLLGFVWVMLLVAFATASMAWAGPCFLCRKPALDTPISLAVGTVRTPDFPVKHEVYTISIQVERTLPAGELNCMLGVKRPWQPDHCGMFHFETVLEADWTVWDGDNAVAHGSVHGIDDNVSASKDILSKQIGDFVGEKNKRYCVELKFTKDGTPLNVTNPRLIVMMTKPSDLLP